MNSQITHGPSFAMVRVDLAPGERLVAEAGAMVARSTPIQMEVKMTADPNPGFGAKLKAIFIAFIRKAVGGESFFVNHFTAPSGGSVWLAPSLAGQVAHHKLSGGSIILSSGAYVASAGDVKIGVKFGGLKGILAKEGAFFLEVGGNGEVWFNSYGGIEVIDVNGSYMVDNGHLVGYEGNLKMSIRSAGGGLMGMMASGEGLVCEFSGQGKLYIQSRNINSLLGYVTPLLPH